MKRHTFQTLHFVESPGKSGSYTEVAIDLPDGYELPTHFHLMVTLVGDAGRVGSGRRNELTNIEVWRAGRTKEIK